MTDHKTTYRNFEDFLILQQKAAKPGLDIRKHVLSKTDAAISVGYVKSNLLGYGLNLKNLFNRILRIGEKGWENSDIFFALGTIYQDEKKSHKGAGRVFRKNRPGAEIILFEQGFLASTHSWSHAFKEGNPKYACLGYVYDDMAHYFMTDYPNRLIEKLNSPEQPSESELVRARTSIDRIVAAKISKYNAQPMSMPKMAKGYKHRILVCDQAFADASTIHGKLDERRFQDMLVAAITENPDAEILVKSHPDTSWENNRRRTRGGYYSHLYDYDNVRFLPEPINPYALFELVDTVYVGSSQMGLEALFAGKKVICFGAPFFAGWGLTDDRQHIPHRHRTRTLEEVFHYFYIWYTIYHCPEKRAPCEIEDVLDYICAHRPPMAENPSLARCAPKVLRNIAASNFRQKMAARPTSPGLVNYGYCGWRKSIFRSVLRPFVKRHGNSHDLLEFEREPASFFQSLTAPRDRIAQKIFFPRFDVFGPFGVLNYLTPVAALLVEKIGGKKERNAFELEPVVYVRRLSDRKYRVLGRLFYPFGELIESDEESR